MRKREKERGRERERESKRERKRESKRGRVMEIERHNNTVSRESKQESGSERGYKI